MRVKTAAPELVEWIKRERKRDPKSCPRFPSKHEAERWVELVNQQREGRITELDRQVTFWLHARRPDGLMEQITRYIADFVYRDAEGSLVVEDAKGFRSETYDIKANWFALEQGFKIKEV